MSDDRQPPPGDELLAIWEHYEADGHKLTVLAIYADRDRLELARDVYYDNRADGLDIPADRYGVVCSCGCEPSPSHDSWEDAMWWVREHLLSHGRDPQHWVQVVYVPSSAAAQHV